MNGINGAIQPTHESFFFTCDPIPSKLSQNSSLMTPTNFIFQRGKRYKVYAELRETKIRMRHKLQTEEEEEDVLEAPKFTLTPTPPKKKRVTFQGSVGVSGTRNAMSMVAKSVPDFSATLRKENRKPMEMNTPPSSLKNSSSSSKMSKLRGSKSAGGGDKGCGGIVRKSYASIEDLKGLGSSVSSAINGEGKGVGRSFRGIQKTVLGYRQY